jgi:large-conductance mechanosensitive channel
MSPALAPSLTSAMPSAHGLLSRHAYFLHWGVIQISLTNFIIIVLVIFVLALVLPFPGGKGGGPDKEGRGEY